MHQPSRLQASVYLDRSEQGQNKDYKAAELKCLGKHKGEEQSKKLIMGHIHVPRAGSQKWLWIN